MLRLPIAIAAGLLVGSVAAAVVRRVFDRDDRPEALRNSARPLATLAFSLALIIGLVAGLVGFLSVAKLKHLLGYDEDELEGTSIDFVVNYKKSGSLVEGTPSGLPREAVFESKYGESIPVSYTCSIIGGDGNDQLWGGAGHDTMTGDDGKDTVKGGDSEETIND